MTHRLVKGFLTSQPFVPFVVTTTDGRRLGVVHPEFAALSRLSLVVFSDGDVASVEISLLQIASVERDVSGVSAEDADAEGAAA